jgi:two-component system chemotaxis response regulator CheY
MDRAELSARHVLVADDDRVSRLAMEDLLRGCGPVAATLVEDGPSAWAQLQGPGHFDLVCLDVRMPAPDGLELVARIRRAPALRRMPVMLITSSGDRETQLEATRLELQGFIVKPVGGQTAERVRRVLAHLDAAILEPADKATARLRVDAERYRRYVGAFVQQLRALHGQAGGLGHAGASARAAFAQKADACRAVALTLGATRIEQLVADAAAAAGDGRPSDANAVLGLARHWLERVAAGAPATAAAPVSTTGR